MNNPEKYYVNGYGYLNVYRDGRIVGKRGFPLKQNINKDGYLQIKIETKDSDGIKKYKEMRVHRILAFCFIPNPENKPQINHIDGNKTNNNLNNLEWVTPYENVNHAIKSGLFSPVGESNPNAKLTQSDVLEIKRKYRNGSIINHLAKEYGVSWNTIDNIIKERNWN